MSTRDGLIVLSIFTYQNADESWAPDNEAEVTIARIAKQIIEAWATDGLDPAGFKPKLQNGAR